MKDRRLILHELARPQDFEDLKVLASNARFTEEARYVWHTFDQVTEEVRFIHVSSITISRVLMRVIDQ